jgi:hypothetical protein
MQNAIRSACREGKNKCKNEGEKELPGAGEAVSCCVAGGAVAEAGGGVLAHGRRLPAAALLFRTAGICFFQVFSTRLQLSLLIFRFLSLSVRSLLSLVPSVFSLFFLPFVFLSFVFFSSVFSASSPLSSFFSSAFLGSIYRAKGMAFYCSHREQPAGRPLGATAKVRPPSPVFWQVRGGWSAIVFGRWAPGEGGTGKNSNKSPFSLLPRCNVWGGRRKRNSVVQNDTVLLLLFFSFSFLNV